MEKIAEMQRVVAQEGIGARVLRLRPDGQALGYCAIVVGRGSIDEPELGFRRDHVTEDDHGPVVWLVRDDDVTGGDPPPARR